MRKQDELGHSSTVSTKVIDFEQKLIRMLPIPDNIPQYNLIKSQMEKEIRKLKNEITNKKRKVNQKSQFYRDRRTKSMKERDNLIRRLRRCVLRILHLKTNDREKYILKRIRLSQLSQEYEEVSRKIILEQQG